MNEFKTIDEHAEKASDRDDYTDTEMIVERSIKTYYAIAIAALSDLLKYLAPDFKPMRSQKKNNGILCVIFLTV